MKITKKFIVLGLMGLIIIPASQAALLRGEFSGVVTNIQGSLQLQGVNVGDVFRGEYTFESTATDIVSSPNNGQYQFSSPLTVRFGNDFFSSPDHQIGITNNVIGGGGNMIDQYMVDNRTPGFVDPQHSNIVIEDMAIAVTDTNATVFSDDSLPGDIDLALFEQSSFVFLFSTPGIAGSGAINGDLQTLEINEVPLPGAVWLFSSALVGLLGFKKKLRC